ncbi:MAG: hypothetical protein AAFN77_03655 [Planctomycetota bacterium]
MNALFLFRCSLSEPSFPKSRSAIFSTLTLCAIAFSLCALTTTAHAQTGQRKSSSEQRRSDSVKPPKMSDYERQFKVFLRNSKTKQDEIQRAAIYNLCHLHWIIISDSRFKTHDKMKSIRASIGRRLSDWHRKQSRITDQKNSGDFASETYRDEGTTQPDSIPVFGAAEDELELVLFQQLSESSSLLGDISGGPSQLFHYSGGQFAPPWDHAPELIALIQATINPKVWRDAGGVSSMQYYQPALALVVSASQETHDDICELLGQLRAAF